MACEVWKILVLVAMSRYLAALPADERFSECMEGYRLGYGCSRTHTY